VRDFRRREGLREKGYASDGEQDYMFAGTIKRYPLHTVQDYRMVVSGAQVSRRNSVVRGVAYHFHNFFDSFETARHKYVTYSHADKRAANEPLAAWGLRANDIELMVRCTKNVEVSQDAIQKHNLRTRSKLSFEEIGHDFQPLFFLNETYRKQRAVKVRQMVEEDERRHPAQN
jgi:hypothetical protein